MTMASPPVRADEEPSQVELEQTLFHDARVWFYRVPSTQVSTLVPRADAWDPEHPFMTGALRVVQRGDACWVRLYEPAKETDSDSDSILNPSVPVLFAQCPLVISTELTLEVYVQDCADSSRYFMLRVEDEATGRRAFLGVGFPERSSAFNFKAALQDYVKYVHRQMMASQAASADAQQVNIEGAVEATPKLGIPEGSTIRINLKMKNGEELTGDRRRRSRGDSQETPGNAAAIPLLPPPPAADPVVTVASSAHKTHGLQAVAQDNDDDDDWGDFTSA